MSETSWRIAVVDPETGEDTRREVDPPVTLAEVLGEDVKEKIAVLVKGQGRKDSSLGMVRRVLWRLGESKVNAKVDELMNLAMGDTLGARYVKYRKVWEKVREIHEKSKEYLAATPKKPFQLSLGFERTLRWDHKHSVKVEIEGWQVSKLDFEIELSFTFGEKATVAVADGAVYSVSLGVCIVEGKFTIKVDDVPQPPIPLPPDGKKLELRLPGPIHFKPEIKFLPPARGTREPRPKSESAPPSSRDTKLRARPPDMSWGS